MPNGSTAPGYESPTEDNLICKPHRPRTQRKFYSPGTTFGADSQWKDTHLDYTAEHVLALPSFCELHINRDEEKIHFLTTRPQGGHLPGGKARYRNYCAATDVAALIRFGEKIGDFRRDLNFGRFVFNDPHLHSLQWSRCQLGEISLRGRTSFTSHP